MPQKILIIDASHSTHEQLLPRLTGLDYLVESAFSGADAFAYLEKTSFDLVLMDLALPDMGGFYLLQQLQQFSGTRIIALSSDENTSLCVRALYEGADDFIAKPILSFPELLMRIRAVLKRRGREYILLSQIKIDLVHERVWRNEQEIDLTPQQFHLLRALASHPNQIRRYEELVADIYELDNDYLHDNRSIYVLVCHLRKRLESNPHQPTIIQTVRGIGYCLKNT